MHKLFRLVLGTSLLILFFSLPSFSQGRGRGVSYPVPPGYQSFQPFVPRTVIYQTPTYRVVSSTRTQAQWLPVSGSTTSPPALQQSALQQSYYFYPSYQVVSPSRGSFSSC